MKVFDDGSGSALYVAGFFNKVGTLSVPGVARWNGSNWSALGSGLDGVINSFAVFKDGSGSALFAGGQFAIVERGQRQECSVAKWNGTRWMAIGESGRALLDQFVFSLTVHDDGSGPALYAGGAFGGVQGTQRRLRSVAKWTGSDWVPLARGPSGDFGTVRAMVSFDDGFGARLYVGGSFGSAAPSSVSGVAQWDGNVWTGLEGGLEGANGDSSVNAMLIHDDGQGRGVYFGGAFLRSAGKSPFVSNRMAKWYRSSVPCPPAP